MSLFIRLLLLFFPLALSAAEPLIKSKKFKNESVRFKFNNKFSKKYLKNDLVISYPEEIDLKSLPHSVIEIPAIAISITTIWLSGNVYTIDEMDEEFYYSLEKLKKFFIRYFPNTPWKGELRPGRLVKNFSASGEPRPAMLFTSGVDSTATLCRHYDENPILISFNQPNSASINFSKEHGFDFYAIYSNYENFFNNALLNHISPEIIEWLWDTSQSLTWIGLTAPFLYAKGVSKLYIASDLTWKSYIYKDGRNVSRATNPVIDENLSPFGIKVIHDAFDKIREEKIEIIAEFCSARKCSKPPLVVCFEHRVNAPFNCCHCEKCYRTMLNIMTVGEDPTDWGFHLSIDDFIPHFKRFINSFQTNHRVIYSFYDNSQQYMLENLKTLPLKYLPFYEWYVRLDLWKILKEKSRPTPSHPFTWEDYRDLYPEMPENPDD